MNKKLTLSLDEQAILIAKHYAQSTHSTVSALVERYFRALQQEQNQADLKESLVSQISGVICIPVNYDEKADYRQARGERYL